MVDLDTVVGKLRSKVPLSLREQQLASADLDAILGEDVYGWAIAMGKQNQRSQVPLLEAILHYPGDSWAAKAALVALCAFSRQRYRESIISFLDGVWWDEDADCRLAAISEAGELLRTTRDPMILAKLINIVDTEAERALMREAAVDALGRAMGKEWSELSLDEDKVNLGSESVREIMMAARKRKEREMP